MSPDDPLDDNWCTCRGIVFLRTSNIFSRRSVKIVFKTRVKFAQTGEVDFTEFREKMQTVGGEHLFTPNCDANWQQLPTPVTFTGISHKQGAYDQRTGT